MNWPRDKIITLPDGMLQCRDCKLVVADLTAFNAHNCKPWVPPQLPPRIVKMKPKPEDVWKRWF